MDSKYQCEYYSENINELIIHFVRSRPELWDLSNQNYKNIFKKKLAWMEIAKELNMEGNIYLAFNFFLF